MEFVGLLILVCVAYLVIKNGKKEPRNRYCKTEVSTRRNSISSTSISQRIEFSYKNEHGEFSRRVVDVRRKDSQYFSGFCSMRRENRTFRYDRIIDDVIVVDTGEILSPSQFSGNRIVRQDQERRTIGAQVQTIEAAEKRLKIIFGSYDWVFETSSNEISMYRKFKNGKTRKTPDVYLLHSELRDDGTPKKRPWYVRSNVIDEGSSFGSLQKALDRFEEYAELTAQELGLSQSKISD